MIKIIMLNSLYGIIFFLTLIQIHVQRKTKRLRHNPGQIILGILVSQNIMSLFIMFSQFYQVENFVHEQEYLLLITESTCEMIAIPSLLASTIYNLLNILLIGNLYCQIYAKNYNDFNLKMEIKIGIIGISLLSLILVLIFKDLGVSILGDCNLESNNVFSTLLVYLRGILMIILSTMLIKLLKYPPEILQTEIYKTVIEKFIKKYLQTYIKINVTYGLLYVFIRLLIPIVINYFQKDQNLRIICQMIQAVGTLIMTILRLHEPIIHRHVRYLFRRKKLVLQQRLLDKNNKEIEDQEQNSYQNIQIAPQGQDINSIGIKLYNQRKNKSVALSLESFQPLQLLPQESNYEVPQQNIKIIQHEGHNKLNLFLQASYEMFGDYQYFQQGEKSSFYFNKMQQKQIELSNNKNILITTYGQEIISHKVNEYFGITLKQIKSSLDIEKNLECMENQEVNQGGTIFLTYDNLISMEFITKEQKRQLTKGGGMQQLWLRYEQEYTCGLGIFLPVIIGLHSYNVDEDYFTLVFKLNRLKLKYPLLDEQWSQQFVLNELISQNIIGWITIDNGIYNKRYLASEVQDGKYKIVLKRGDYNLAENDKQSLIDMIKRDYITMQQMKCSMTIHFIFTKHTASRLNSLVGKEKQVDQDQSIVTQSLKQQNEFIGQMASYELKTKLGYVQVFWDDCWKYYDSQFERVLEIINNKF